jgi:hypothetical protein
MMSGAASLCMNTRPPQPGQKQCSSQRPAALPRRHCRGSPSIDTIAGRAKRARTAKALPVARWHSRQQQA